MLIQPERADQPEVQALLNELDRYLGELYEPQDNHILDIQALLAPDVHFVVAREAQSVLGCAAFRRIPGDAATNGEAYGEIKRMMVSESARGRGIGAALLAALEAAMMERGLSLALLETGEAQVQAIGLYERAGYQRRAAFGGYPDNGLSQFMSKRLIST